MTPGKYNLVTWKNSTYRLLITVYKPDGVTPENFTGYTAVLNMYASVHTPPPIYQMTTLDGGITLGGVGGTVALYISATDTLSFGSWSSRSAIYELDLIDTGASGDTIPLLWGTVEVRGIV